MVLVKPDGTFVEVPDSSLQKAANAGYRTPTAEELDVVEARRDPGGAFGAGTARGATLGATDLLMGGPSRPRVARALKLTREENPFASAAGELVGAIASIPVTRGLGLAGAAKLGLQGTKAVVAREAIQGGLWGMGSAVSEAAMDDTDATGEHLAAGALAGGLTNAALGAAFRGVGHGVSRLAKKVSLPAVQDTLMKGANTLEKHALGIADHEYADDILTTALANEMTGATSSPQKVLTKAVSRRKEVGAQIEGILTNADEGILAAHKAGNSAPTTVGEALAAHPMDVGDLAQTLKTAMAPYARSPAYMADVAKVMKIADNFATIESELRAGNGVPLGWKDVFKAQSDLLNSIERTSSPNTERVFKGAQVALRDWVEQHAEAALPPWERGKFKIAIKEYAQFSALADAAQSQLKRGTARLENAASSSGAGLAFGQPVVGATVGLGKAAFAPRVSFVAGAALRGLSDSGMLEKIASAFQKQVFAKMAVLPFAVQQRLTDAAARGSLDLLEEHTRLAQGDPSYLPALGMQNESPEEVANLGPRLASLMAVDNSSQAMTTALNGSVEQFFSKPGRPARSFGSTPSRKEFDTTAAAVQQIVRDPESVFFNMPSEFTSHAPATAGAAAATVVRAARFLDGKLPKDPGAGLPDAIRRPWGPPKVEMVRWFRYVDAVQNPLGVVEKARHGVATPEHMEALDAVYPLLAGQIRRKMTETLKQWKRPIPYSRRMGVASWLGPAASGMTQQQMQMIQQSHATVSPPATGKPDGRQKVDAEKNMQTQAQRTEGR